MTTRFSPTARRRHLAYLNEAAALQEEYRVSFLTCYAYSPKGSSDLSRQSRLLCARVKAGDRKWLRRYVACLREQMLLCRGFTEHFAPRAVLIPVPPSDCSVPAHLWPTQHLAAAMAKAGLATSVWMGLSRLSTVGKSSRAWNWERPTVPEHYRSFGIAEHAMPAAQVILIDDVITKGRTLAAAALRLRDAFPQAGIRAFALVRTLGFVTDISRLVDPCQGEIRWNGEDACRDP